MAWVSNVHSHPLSHLSRPQPLVWFVGFLFCFVFERVLLHIVDWCGIWYIDQTGLLTLTSGIKGVCSVSP